MQKNTIIIFTAVLFLMIGIGSAYPTGERTITDRSKQYSPITYAKVDFVNRFNRTIPGLENLGETIDKALLYSDVKMLTEASALLGYCEKQWNVKSSRITAQDLMDNAENIANFRKSSDEIKAIINVYNERSISVYNPEKAEKYETMLKNLETHPAGKNQCGIVLVRNNTRKKNINVYVNNVYMGTVRANKSVKFKNIPIGRIELSANDGDNRKWGPRQVYLTRYVIFRWELYL